VFGDRFPRLFSGRGGRPQTSPPPLLSRTPRRVAYTRAGECTSRLTQKLGSVQLGIPRARLYLLLSPRPCCRRAKLHVQRIFRSRSCFGAGRALRGESMTKYVQVFFFWNRRRIFCALGRRIAFFGFCWREIWCDGGGQRTAAAGGRRLLGGGGELRWKNESGLTFALFARAKTTSPGVSGVRTQRCSCKEPRNLSRHLLRSCAILSYLHPPTKQTRLEPH